MRKIALLLVLSILISFPASAGNKFWELYFTEPGKKVVTEKNPASGIIKIIKQSKKYFYGAFYEISYRPVIEELINAKKRGIDVKLVTEQKNYKGHGIDMLVEAGIEIVQDTNNALMHNKFAVIDGEYIWTGSYNLTKNCTLKNNNNAILIKSEALAEIYLSEFNEMFIDRTFGNKTDPKPFNSLTNRYHIKIDETNINVFFSPEDNVERIILSHLKKAKKSIQFMAFSFTSKRISDQLINKSKDGVRVSGIFEKGGTKGKYSEFNKLKIEGLNVKTAKNSGKMHHKVIIIDEDIVITGSYNFSRGADRKNDENILIIDNHEITAYYLAEFKRLFNQ